MLFPFPPPCLPPDSPWTSPKGKEGRCWAPRTVCTGLVSERAPGSPLPLGRSLVNACGCRCRLGSMHVARVAHEKFACRISLVMFGTVISTLQERLGKSENATGLAGPSLPPAITASRAPAAGPAPRQCQAVWEPLVSRSSPCLSRFCPRRPSHFVWGRSVLVPLAAWAPPDVWGGWVGR